MNQTNQPASSAHHPAVQPLTTPPNKAEGAGAEKSTDKGGDKGPGKSPYRATLNLPQTLFPMKANLVQNEPASVKRWSQMKLYEKVRAARAGRDRYVFHDGPPYANGGIHLGHLMNKCLKDFVVRTKTMAGLDCSYIPGWDCHGLPIEHKVMTEMMEAGNAAKAEKLKSLTEAQRRMAVRRECQKSAEKYIKLQAAEMVRLLTMADYEHPYMTMAPTFEGATLEVLAGLMEQGLVARALKPVHWSIANETALAEAELEYYDREDLSIYVDFEADDAGKVYDAFGLPEDINTEGSEEETEQREEDSTDGPEEAGDEAASKLPKPGVRPGVRPSFMIWTTTPWTLPANLAIAVNEKFEYALVYVDGNVTVMARDAIERVTQAAKAEDVVVIATTLGKKLLGLRYRHPFVASSASASVFTILPADYVTLEDGTGLVHTAPGHGTEDYQTGLRWGLPVYCPVKHDGTYDATAPDWLRGITIWDANQKVVDHIKNSGHLFYAHKFTHSYPHDWRGKTPVIFRATEQWFVRVDQPTKREQKTLRQMALQAASEPNTDRKGDRINFVPEWGRNRMRGMLESRPDWCISRQRAWGLPIPAFVLPDGSTLMTAASIRAVAKLVREKGSDIWFTAEAEELLKYYDAGSDPAAPAVLKDLTREPEAHLFSTLKKGPDILDVWFESGSSWNAVMRERKLAWDPKADGKPAFVDLYLEGSDQHRGWFQSSLLPCLGATGYPPFATVLTHGFMVDKDGRKMSKSLGNTLNVEDLLKDFGADVCRWWVASLAYENDIKVDRDFFGVAGESYRKVRNTLKFLLSNLADFTPSCDPSGKAQAGHCVDLKSYPPTSIDAWVLGEYNTLAGTVLAAYEAFEFRTAQQAIYNFCNDTLSSVYLAAVKDRLYCDKVDSPRRRRCQSTIWDLTDGLCRLLAPILVHTADEAFRSLWKCAHNDDATTVHLGEFIRKFEVGTDARWPKAMAARDKAMQSMERARAATGGGGQGSNSGSTSGLPENPLDMGVVMPDLDGSLARFDPVDLADLLGVSRVSLDAKAGETVVLDLRSEPRCDRSWKRDETVKQRSDGGLLTDRDAQALGI